MPQWAQSPSMIIGCHVEKRFGQKWHVGKITDVDIDKHSNERIWEVTYDDGDAEDCNAQEMVNISCSDLHVLL